MLDPAAPQVVAVDVQQVEGVIGEPLGLALRYGIVEEIEMRHATIIGNGDLAVDDQLVAGAGERLERGGEDIRAVIAVAACQRRVNTDPLCLILPVES